MLNNAVNIEFRERSKGEDTKLIDSDIKFELGVIFCKVEYAEMNYCKLPMNF